MKIIRKRAKTIFTKTSLPGCDYTLNQYVGCEHACSYCYAKFILGFKPYGRWGSWVEVKENAPELVKGRYVKGCVWMSSVSDPYQPIEKRLRLTRKVLENMDKRIKLAIQTKSDLVLRDIDLFKKFEKIEIGLTINGFEGEIKTLFEPFSSTHKQRIKALKVLKKEGFATYAFISPIIPKLVDVRKCVEETQSFVDYYWFEMLNLAAAGKEFEELLQRRFLRSWKMLREREGFLEFIRDLKNLVQNLGVKSKGIILHSKNVE